jgi:hypothetical protein
VARPSPAGVENRLKLACRLILDELGYLPLTREAASLFFRLLFRRYEWASLTVTSNKSFVDWGVGLQRPDPGHGVPRPPAAPRHHRQHQGQ